MKIFFRYLLSELLKPFLFCLVACSALWIVADLFGSLNEFFEKNASWGLVFQFYIAQVPKMLVLVLPVTMLFASLYTLLNLNRHNELTALQNGGVSPTVIFLPFIALAVAVSVFLFFISSGPATRSEATRTRILRQLNNDVQDPDISRAIVFVDPGKNRIWYIASLNTRTGEARNMELHQRDALKNDVEKFFASRGVFTNGHWRLYNVKKILFSADGRALDQTVYAKVDLSRYNTSPADLALIQAAPEELSIVQLFRMLRTAHEQTRTRMAPFATQFYNLIAYPFSVLILLGFAFALGTGHSRRSPAAGVFNAIFILLGYLFVSNFFLAMGRGCRIPSFLAAWASPVIFGLIALGMMGEKFGWLWSLRRWLDTSEPAGTTAYSLATGASAPPHLAPVRLPLCLKRLWLLLDNVIKDLSRKSDKH
jgi:lipopolysaccharide export system permease protein